MANPMPATEKKQADNGKPAKRARKRAPENETKAEKFVRLANMRMVRFLKTASAVANLANQNVYDSSPAQREKIVNAVKNAAKTIEDKFAAKKEAETPSTFF